jgi:hypothetical protein
MKRIAIGALALILALAAASAVRAVPTRSLDTLNLHGAFKVAFHPAACPAGTPVNTSCYLWAGRGVVPGLGSARESYVAILEGVGTTCAHAHWTAVMTVSGKGTLDAGMQIPGCADQNSPVNPPATFTITGGTGELAGATGSGTLTSQPHELGAGSGTSTDTWRGTVTVAGLTFDTTPPKLAGAHSLHIRARTKRGARARYHLTASDPVDGRLHVTCHPRSGSRFHIGRTRVTCRATDKDGNSATARFKVTVTRAR